MRRQSRSRLDNGCRLDGPARGETGAMLIEVLVALVISAGAIFVLVGGMTALFASSAQNRQTTTAGFVARDYAEVLEGVVAQASAAAVSGAWCSTTYTVPYTPPTGYTVTGVGTCPANTASTTPQFEPFVITAKAPNLAPEQLRVVVRQT
jgi:type II secretory pathway pseudopilin PulG